MKDRIAGLTILSGIITCGYTDLTPMMLVMATVTVLLFAYWVKKYVVKEER